MLGLSTGFCGPHPIPYQWDWVLVRPRFPLMHRCTCPTSLTVECGAGVVFVQPLLGCLQHLNDLPFSRFFFCPTGCGSDLGVVLTCLGLIF